MENEHLMETFYKALNSITKQIVDNAAGGNFMELTFTEVVEMLEKRNKIVRAYDTKDSDIESSTYPSMISAEQRQKEELRDKDMAYLKTKIELLTKLLLSTNV